MDLDTKMEVNSIDGEKKEATMEVVLEEKSSSPEKMQTQPIPIPPEYPSEFDTRDYPHTVEIRKDKISAKYTGVGNHSNDFGSVRTNKPVPAGIQIYYFEVEIVNAGRQASIAVGFSTKDFPLTRQVGTAKNSTGYRGDDGKKYKDESAGQCYGPFFSTEDVIGCGISSHTNSVFFTKNGRSLSTAFEGVRGVFYPTVSLHSPDEMIRINLGDRPFKYDIEGHRADEKAKFDLMVQNTPVDEACLAPLVREYLAHSGYVNALKTFDEALGSDSEQHMVAIPKLRRIYDVGILSDAHWIITWGNDPRWFRHQNGSKQFLEACQTLLVWQCPEVPQAEEGSRSSSCGKEQREQRNKW